MHKKLNNKRRFILDKIKVGVIGVGHLGRFHALNYNSLPNAELVGVFDSDAKKAEVIAAESNCRKYDNIDSLLLDVEAISLAVPTDLHFDIGIKILDNGIHCLIEKPITSSLEEADTLIKLAEDKNLILHVGHIEKFNPAMRSLANFDIQPQFIESHRLAPFNPRGTEVSVVLDLMIHDIEIVLDLIKSPRKRIDASGVAVVSDTIDIANARIQFENNSAANLTASRISQKKMRKMRMFQKNAYITVDFLNSESEIFNLDNDDTKYGKILGEIGTGNRKKKIYYHKPPIPEEMGLEKELDAFIRTINGETPSAVTGRAAKEALSVAFEILKQIT